MKRVVIRTHGGLGNQIFQIFYALVKHGDNIVIVHDSRYPHGFQLADPFQSRFTNSATKMEKLICHFRIVKLIEKLSLGIPEVRIGDTFFMDGYFQKFEIYRQFSTQRITFALEQMRDILRVDSNPKEKLLCHLRLSDFYYTNIERVEAAKERLSALANETDFISSDDALIINDGACQDIIMAKKLNHINTIGYSAIEIFCVMAKYKEVESNNSTLAFWSAILNKTNLSIDDKNLLKLYRFLKSCDSLRN